MPTVIFCAFSSFASSIIQSLMMNREKISFVTNACTGDCTVGAARRLRLRAALWGGRSWEKALTFHEAVTDWERMLFIVKSVLSNAAPTVSACRRRWRS